jgi:hypothetical protein
MAVDSMDGMATAGAGQGQRVNLERAGREGSKASSRPARGAFGRERVKDEVNEWTNA